MKAFKEHKLSDVFLQPGDCDLTADVDFLFLKHIAEKSNSKSNIFLYFYSKIYFSANFSELLRTSKSRGFFATNANLI